MTTIKSSNYFSSPSSQIHSKNNKRTLEILYPLRWVQKEFLTQETMTLNFPIKQTMKKSLAPQPDRRQINIAYQYRHNRMIRTLLADTIWQKQQTHWLWLNNLSVRQTPAQTHFKELLFKTLTTKRYTLLHHLRTHNKASKRKHRRRLTNHNFDWNAGSPLCQTLKVLRSSDTKPPANYDKTRTRPRFNSYIRLK